jgi:tetratricopeptide (TPR) repeat protein
MIFKRSNPSLKFSPTLRWVIITIAGGALISMSFFRHFVHSPIYSDVYTQIGMELIQKGQLPKAKRYFERAISLNPENAQAYLGLGESYWQQGETGLALRAVQSATYLDNQNHAALDRLGQIYYKLGYLERALQSFQAAIKVEGNYIAAPQYHYHLGQVYNQKGLRAEVLAEVSAIKKLDSPDLARQLEQEMAAP